MHCSGTSRCIPVTSSMGGPRAYHRRGRSLPERYLPGRFFTGLQPELRRLITRAVNGRAPAPWFLRLLLEEECAVVRHGLQAGKM